MPATDRLDRPTAARRIRVLLVEDDPGDAVLAEAAVGSIDFDIERVDRLSGALQRLSEVQFDVVLLDLTLPDSTGIDSLLKVQSETPMIPVVIMTGVDDESLAARAIAQGAQDYVVKGSFGPQTLQRAIRFAVERQRRSTLSPESGSSVTSVIGLKGGVGKTTVASNIAAQLLQLERQPVTLLDLSLQAGDVAVTLRAAARPSIADFCTEWPDVNAAYLDGLLQTTSGGVRVLPAPHKIEACELVTSEHVDWILDSLTQHDRYVVVDHSAWLTDLGFHVLERSDHILYVLDLELTSAAELRRTLSFFKATHMPSRSLMLIVNKGDARANVTLDDLETSLGIPIVAVIPTDTALFLRSEREGRPAVLIDKKNQVAQAYQKLAVLIQAQPRISHLVA